MNMTDTFGDVVGKPKRCFTSFMPMISSFFSSLIESVHDSALLRRQGRTHVSYNERITLVSMPLMTSDEAVVFICLIKALALLSRDIMFLSYLQLLVNSSPRYFYTM